MDRTEDLDRRVEDTRTALLERYAPGTILRQVRWSQGETRVLELGDGPPLLLVHGGGDSAVVWAPILAPLARTHHIFAVDRPGHGLADPFDYRGVDLHEHAREFLRDTMDALELPTVDIVANSIGGLWSAVFAIDAPDRVSRLVLVGGPPGVTRGAPIQLRLLGLPLIGQPLARRLMSDPTRDAARKFWGELLVVHPERLEDDLLDADVANMRRNVDSILSLIFRMGDVRGLRRELLIADDLRSLRVPTAFLCGDRDEFMSTKVRRAWREIAERNPNIDVVALPAVGHDPWIDDPDLVVGEIDRFLAKERGGRRMTA